MEQREYLVKLIRERHAIENRFLHVADVLDALIYE